MKHTYTLLIAIFLATPFTSIAGDITEHSVIVPQEHAWGRGQEAFSGTSPIERYVSAYERTWWKVMRAFVYRTDEWTNHASFICSGTSAEADACINAYEDARKRIEAWVNLSREEEFRSLVRERLSK